MTRLFSVCFVGALFLLPALLIARPAQRQAPPIQKGHTTFDYTYEDGLLKEKFGTRHDAEGHIQGYSQTVYEYERRRPLTAMRTEYDSDMLIKSTHKRDHLYEGKRNLGYDLMHRDVDGRQVQRMEARNHVMVDRLGLVHELKIFNQVDKLVQVHYVATDKDKRGRVIAKDVSIYDAEGVQRSRRLYTWTHDEEGVVVEKALEVFDQEDQSARVEEAVVVWPERGLERTEWTLYDPNSEITGYREVDLRRDPKKRKR